MSDTQYTLIDSLQPNEPKATDSAGTIHLSAAGLATTSRPEVADEVRSRYPHMRVVAHEPLTGGRATRKLWTMPELPYKKNKSKEDTTE